jgi:hypothetical protein
LKSNQAECQQFSPARESDPDRMAPAVDVDIAMDHAPRDVEARIHVVAEQPQQMIWTSRTVCVRPRP